MLAFNAGDAQEARRRFDAALPSYRASRLHQVAAVAAEHATLHASLVLSTSSAKPSLDQAKRYAGVVQRTPWLPAPALDALILAANAVAERQIEEAASQLAAAGALSDSRGLKGFAAAARMRLGRLLGGDAGCALAL
jgi:hypothetical protein